MALILQGKMLDLLELPKRKKRELTEEEKEERREKVDFDQRSNLINEFESLPYEIFTIFVLSSIHER